MVLVGLSTRDPPTLPSLINFQLQVQMTYFLATNLISFTQGWVVFMDFPDNGLPKLCPLTLISPHQSPYSKNFREGHTCSSNQSSKYSFSWTQTILLWQDLYLSLGSWCSGSFKWLLLSENMHTQHTQAEMLNFSLPYQNYDYNHSGKFPSYPTITSFSKENWDTVFFLPRRSDKYSNDHHLSYLRSKVALGTFKICYSNS